jgi:hypothetical protein
MTSCFLKQVLREKSVQQKATGAFDGAATDGNAAAGEGEHAGVRQGEEERERCEETAEEGGRAAGAMREMRIRVVSHPSSPNDQKNQNQKLIHLSFFQSQVLRRGMRAGRLASSQAGLCRDQAWVRAPGHVR